MIHNAVAHGRGLMTAYGDLTGLSEGEEGTVRLGESLTPILNAHQLPEAAILRDEHLFAGTVSVAAVAAEFSFIGIRNHTGSGKLMVVQHANAGAAAAGVLFWTVSLQLATDVDDTTAVRPRDTRWVNTPGFNLIRGTGAGIVGDQFWRHVIPANETGHLPSPFVLHPGRDLRVYFDVVNTALHASFAGMVRQFKPSENITK